jgi:hypothetical protein
MKRLLVIVMILIAFNTAYAQEDQSNKKCSDVNMAYCSFSIMLEVGKDAKLGDILKSHRQTLEKFAGEQKLKRFSIMSEDISVNPTSYSDRKDGYVSFSVEFESDYEAINAFASHIDTATGQRGLSISIAKREVCEEK